MAKRGHRTTIDRILFAITALFVLGGLLALGFSKDNSGENRALLVLVSSLGILTGMMALVFVSTFWKRLRRWTWQRSMLSWERASWAGHTPKFVLADGVQENELWRLVIQTYSRMGYLISDEGTAALYLKLINPDGRVELVACQKLAEPVKLHHVYSLQLEMKRMKAVRAFFWSPCGFTSEAIQWAMPRQIVLADPLEIGRLVDCAALKGSTVLESH
ncbi:MAG TPA: hypothetical protein VFY26_05020 [Anaerolineales bacterium]|nr:hypothetical protein [Anaerolineales bacterium]